MLAPPFVAGTIQDKATAPSPGTPTNPVGGAGVVLGVNASVWFDAPESPASFVALTVNTYVRPLIRLATSHSGFGVALGATRTTVQTTPPGLATTVYLVTAFPPSNTGGFQSR